MEQRFLAGVAKLLSCIAPMWFMAAPLGGYQEKPGDAGSENFRVYNDHPRLFLRAQRLRLLRRERERNSMRWDQFNLFISGGAPMPEPAFANALYYQVALDPAAAHRAIAWAAGSGKDSGKDVAKDLRQLALVYDWCQEQMSPAERKAILAHLRSGLQRPVSSTVANMRSRAMAAIALAGDDDSISEATLQTLVRDEWRGRIIRSLRAGTSLIGDRDTYPLLELFHAVRDNLNFDLRDDYPALFRQLPLFGLLSYYPPPYPAAENEFHIPFSPQPGEPDLTSAALSRAGELAMVAYDTNAPESQVLQGWLMNDRFLMRGTFGIPYEFLWANPYQPGLSYYHVPLVLHDDLFGRLLVRSSWDDDARWAGYIDGKLQVFQDGRAMPVEMRGAKEPLDMEEAVIFFASQSDRLQSGKKDANDIFIVGLTPQADYHVEVDGEEMREMTSDPGGILYLKGVRPETPIRFSRESVAPGLPAATGR